MPVCLLSALAGVLEDVEFLMDSRAPLLSCKRILCLGILLSFHILHTGDPVCLPCLCGLPHFNLNILAQFYFKQK